jgi:hypothetical protein
MTTRRVPCLSLLLVVLGAASCRSSDRGIIDAWLGCTECKAGELDSVVALATVRRAPTVATLQDDLLAGPSATRIQNMSRQLDSSYKVLVAVRAPDPVPPRSQFIQRYLDNVIGAYRVRAAVALATIGGNDVLPALDSAADNKLRVPTDSLRPADSVAVRLARDVTWHP